MRIRHATRQDGGAIRRLYQCAFAEAERDSVATLATQLLTGLPTEKISPPSISLLAVVEGELAGHAAFSAVFLKADQHWQGYIVAPLAVQPRQQGKGIGAALVEHGIQLLQEGNNQALFVYGDPAYYSRFGFTARAAAPYLPPYPLRYPFGWQALMLRGAEPAGQALPITCVPALNLPELW